MIKHTLVGYDGSDSAKRAFKFAAELMRATGGKVRVLSVLQVTEGAPGAAAVMMTDKGAAHQDELRAELAALAPEDVDRIEVEVAYGSPGDVLLAQIEAHEVDHIVIGHTERGALLRWLLGSVSSAILARAAVPVTVVR